MSDWKEYLEKAKEFRIAEWTKEYNQAYKNGFDNSYNHLTKELGLFFWGRGGKQFVLNHIKNMRKINNLKLSAEETIALKDWEEFITLEIILWARDFLDCLACLGSKKVKELIKGVETKNGK